MKNKGLSGNVSRRAFLGATTAAMALALPSGAAAAEPRPGGTGAGLIDVNVSLFRWPMRRLACDETPALLAKLRRHGVTQTWAGSFEGLLHKDLAGVNERLVAECRRHGRGLLRPFGSVNPKAPDWEEELRRCAEIHQMPGIRLHPNYHGYKLDEPEFVRLLHQATDRRLLVQLVVTMEDERTTHPRLRLEPVDLAPLVEVVQQTPGLRLLLLNALRTMRGDPLRKLLSAGDVYVESAMFEGVGGLARLLGDAPLERVLFGSHSPFYYFESAWLKLRESPLTEEQLKAIREKNARHLLTATAAL
jgi:uncharacterized protein